MLSIYTIFAALVLLGIAIGLLIAHLFRKSTPARQGHSPQRRDFIMIVNADSGPFKFKVDLADVEDDKGNKITDPAALAGLVEVHESDNPSVLTVVSDPGQGEGTSTPTGTAGQATQTCKVYADQAAKDAGANPLIIASEAWSVVPGGAAKIGEAKFSFTPEAPPAATP